MSYSRIYFDRSLGRNADEFLEIAFFQVFHDNASDDDICAFPVLLDPYAIQMFGQDAISFAGATVSSQSAQA